MTFKTRLQLNKKMRSTNNTNVQMSRVSSKGLLLLLLLYTTFVKRIIHKLMCSNALSIQ